MLSQELCSSFMPMIAYPTVEYHAQAAHCLELLERTQPAVADQFRPFAEFAKTTDSSDLEELYIQAFDMNPATSLDMSWHLFGETYDRGAFLVAMRQLLKEHGIDEEGELPDNAVHLLHVLPYLDEQRGEDIAVRCLLPGLLTIEGNLKDSPYLAVIVSLRELIQQSYSAPERNGS